MWGAKPGLAHFFFYFTRSYCLGRLLMEDMCRASVPLELVTTFLGPSSHAASPPACSKKKSQSAWHLCLPFLPRRCPDLLMTLASFQNGISTAPAPAKLRVTTVKSSFGIIHQSTLHLHHDMCASLVTALLLTRWTNSPSPLFFLASSPRAIFRDPFRKGENILVTRDHPFADSLHHECWSWVWRETIHANFELFVGHVWLLWAKWKTDSKQQEARGGDDL